MNRIIVIGASAGGVKALSRLARGFPERLPAAVVVVLHVGPYRSILPEILGRAGPLPVAHARHDQRLEAARIYLAPPDQHLLVVGDRLHLSSAAKEHHSRPAIDPLFRSAARAYGAAVIGVILTGTLDDGTAGLQAIKAAGGTTIVQDPDDADVPDMPASALRYVHVDHCVALDELPKLLVGLTKQAPAMQPKSPSGVAVHEQEVFLAKEDRMEHLAKIAVPSGFVGPDCHGGLWELSDVQPRRFRCHTGHAFTIRTLQHTLATASDEALWNARRALQERLLLLREMGSDDAAAIPGGPIEIAVTRLEQQLQELEGLMEHGPEPVE